jgi:ankyrin repeat protein
MSQDNQRLKLSHDLFNYAGSGNFLLLKPLLESRQADHNWRNPDYHGFTALIYCCHGAKPQSKRPMDDAGHHFECAQALLSARCNVNEQDDEGFTALAVASNRGNLAFVDLLLQHGARVQIGNHKKRLPVELAAAGRLRVTLQKNEEYGKVVKLLKRAKKQRDFSGMQLFEAAVDGELEKIKQIVNAGVDIDWQNPAERGATALMKMCGAISEDVRMKYRKDRTGGKLKKLKAVQVDCARYLVETMAEGFKGGKLDAVDHDGTTALGWACATGCTGHQDTLNGPSPFVVLLLEAGAGANIVNLCGYTPLAIAAVCGQQVRSYEGTMYRSIVCAIVYEGTMYRSIVCAIVIGVLQDVRLDIPLHPYIHPPTHTSRICAWLCLPTILTAMPTRHVACLSYSYAIGRLVAVGLFIVGLSKTASRSWG